MHISKPIISSLVLLMILVSFTNESKPRYFEHLGAGVSEIQTSEKVDIANNAVVFLSATKSVVLLAAVDSIFNENIVTVIPDSLTNDTFAMKYFAIPVGIKKFSIQPITPLLPGKKTAMTHSPRPDGLFDRSQFYDGDKRRVGVFKLKNRPYFFLLQY